jgi:hypothetical protein
VAAALLNRVPASADLTAGRKRFSLTKSLLAVGKTATTPPHPGPTHLKEGSLLASVKRKDNRNDHGNIICSQTPA